MGDQTRRVWRAGPATLVFVWLFAVAAGVAIPVLAYLIYRTAELTLDSRRCSPC